MTASDTFHYRRVITFQLLLSGRGISVSLSLPLSVSVMLYNSHPPYISHLPQYLHFTHTLQSLDQSQGVSTVLVFKCQTLPWGGMLWTKRRREDEGGVGCSRARHPGRGEAGTVTEGAEQPRHAPTGRVNV